MQHYQFHIGDYAQATAHLSPLEDLAYRRLLDLYYSTEAPIQSDIKAVARKIRMDQESVTQVLSEFFTLTPEGFRHHRCDEVVRTYHEAKKNHWGQKLSRSARCAMGAERNASKINATPRWLSPEQKREIATKYAEAARATETTGIDHEVDHAVPLRGKTVCGLHVPWNLRVIPAHLNRMKGNTFNG